VAIKSVVDIDLNEEKFKRFTDQYSKYQEALKSQPGEWKDAEKAAGGADDVVVKILAAFMAMGSFHESLREEDEKDNKVLKQKLSLWEKIQKESLNTMHHVEDTAKWFLKWGSIGFGLSLAGLFGLRSVAEDVSEQRNQALGLDVGIGSPAAFARHQGRYFSNPEQVLEGAFTARSNVASPAYQAIASLGINPHQSTVAVANQLLLKIQAMAKAMPQQQVGNLLLEYPGLSQFGIGLQDLERLRGISTGELKGQIAAYAPDVRAAGLTGRQGLAYANFLSSINATFAGMKKAVESDLVPLLGPIERIAKALGSAVSQFLRSKFVVTALNDIATEIEKFANEVSGKKFSDSIGRLESFVQTIDSLGTDISNAAKPFTWSFGHVGNWLGEGAGWVSTNFQRELDNARARVSKQNQASNPRPQKIQATSHITLSVRHPPGGDLITTVSAMNGGAG
jgi:hypothetical protein